MELKTCKCIKRYYRFTLGEQYKYTYEVKHNILNIYIYITDSRFDDLYTDINENGKYIIIGKKEFLTNFSDIRINRENCIDEIMD